MPEGPHPKVTHNTPYRAGKGFVYEGGLRIPLIVRWPGHVPAGEVTDDPVINTDWVPTLLELVGRPVPAGLDGVSFAALLTGRGPAPSGSSSGISPITPTRAAVPAAPCATAAG